MKKTIAVTLLGVVVLIGVWLLGLAEGPEPGSEEYYSYDETGGDDVVSAAGAFLGLVLVAVGGYGIARQLNK